MAQKITSAKTCRKQIPAVMNMIPTNIWLRLDTVVDYGGGKYDDVTELLATMGIRCFVYDPFNRSEAHNAFVKETLDRVPADACFLSNVLNVIREPEERLKALEQIKKWTGMGMERGPIDKLGYVFITVYDGNGTGRGRKTRDGWQNNRTLKSYLPEVRKVFPNAQLVGGGKLIVVDGVVK